MTGAAKRIVLETLGWMLLLLGIAAIFLPGPGLLGIFAGLALLSQQYDWAERRVEPVRLRAMLGAAEGVETWPRIIASCLGAVVLAGFGVLWIMKPPAPEWWPLADTLVAARRRLDRRHPGRLGLHRDRPDHLQLPPLPRRPRRRRRPAPPDQGPQQQPS